MKSSLLLCLVATLPMTGHCDNSDSSTSATNPDKGVEYISVIGTRSSQTQLVLPAAIQIIDRTQITQSGAASVVQILATLGGLQVNDAIGNGGRGASLTVRGFGENGVNNVLVLVDGRKLNNPSLAAPDLASIALQNVERIEILTGSAGALYGDQANGAVINIITRQAAAPEAELGAARGSDHLARYRASASGALASGLSYRVGAETLRSDNFRKNNEQDQYNGFATLGLLRERSRYSIELQRTSDDLRLPGSLSRTQRDTDRTQAGNLTDFGNRDTDSSRFGLEHELSQSWRLLADASYRNEQNVGAVYATPFRELTRIRTLQPRLSGQIATANQAIVVTAGMDLESAEAASDYGFGATNIDQHTRDIYGQISAPFASAWSVTAGARHSQFDGDHQTGANLKQALSVSQIGFRYDINDAHRLFLRRDEGFRWPNANENGFIPPTVAALNPQQSVSVEAGLDSHLDALTLTAVVYQLSLHNEIFYDPQADGPFGPGSGANINLDDSFRHGLNVRGNFFLASAWSAHFNYSYVDAQFDSGSFSGRTVPFVANQQAGIGLSWAPTDTISLYADGQYTGTRYRAGDNANAGGRLGGYSVINASAQWRWQQWAVIARINNLGGKVYDGFSGGLAPFDYYYPAPGRQTEFRVSYAF